MKFIDICAGIGGFRSGLEKAGMECVGYVEIDKYARRSYESMYNTTGEWTAVDVCQINPEDIPDSDLWCFGFPCQDISVAGRQRGLRGERSGIFYDIIKLLKGCNTGNRPEWLLIENVKNLLSIDDGWGFTEVLSEVSEAGYDAEWALLNSKDFGVPQNRERVFVIGHLRERGRQKILPQSGTGRKFNEKSQINKLFTGKHQHEHIYGIDGISRTLTSAEAGGGARTGFYAIPKIKKILNSTQHFSVIASEGISPTISACDYKDPQSVAIPCLTPDKLEKRQNGRRFKGNNEPMFTLTAQDKHGIMLYDGEEYNIRRLTPKECFRLQGFTDEQFEKAKAVNSDSQLYKQAGNAVTVNVAEYLGRLIMSNDSTRLRN